MQEVRHRPSVSAQPDAEMELDDDELLDMMGDMPPPAPAHLPNTLPPVTNTLPGKSSSARTSLPLALHIDMQYIVRIM